MMIPAVLRDLGMTPLVVLAMACNAVTVGLAWALTRRRVEHRPFALFASVVLAVDVARWIIMVACPWIMGAGPWTGWRRAVFSFDGALFNAWAVSLAAVAWAVFLRRRPWPPLIVAGLVLAGLALGYPSPFRGELLGRAYAAIHVAGALTAIVAAALWARRRTAPRPEHAAVLLVALLDLAYLAGPYALPEPWLTWAEGDKVAAATWAGLVLVHAGALWAGFLMPPPGKAPGRAL